MPAPPPRCLAAIACVAVAAAGLLPAQPAGGGTHPCEAPVDVPVQGLSCPTRGGWLVLLRDGTAVLTHGPDTPARHSPEARGPFAAPVPPVCVPGSEPHHRVVYAVPADKPDRHRSLAEPLRALVAEATGVLAQAALPHRVDVRYRVLCTPEGLVRVDHAVLATPSRLASFATIVDDLRAQGYASALAKHWIFYDDHMPGYGGQATLDPDDSPGPDNQNNAGPDYAVVYGHLSVELLLHEGAHAMGAVQASAPHSTGTWHCNDGVDVMCYADGGPSSAYSPGVCPGHALLVAAFDCGQDDYFHPRAEPGSWLATHWNLGSEANRFLSFRPL